MEDKYTKSVISIRYWLQGKEYFKALEAMNFASKYHTGTRKDGITPEFAHQVSIAHFLRTLSPLLIYPEECISVAFLHDVIEDYNVSLQTISEYFGKGTGDASWLITRKTEENKKDIEYYYREMSKCPIASVDKGADRIHNIQSMTGVFTLRHQKGYIEETEMYIIPMLKMARRKFPKQEKAYENIKHMPQSQIKLIKKIHVAGGA